MRARNRPARITHPVANRAVPAGPTAVRGVAWSDGAAITHVELRVDGEAWEPAELQAPPGRFGFTRWDVLWHADPGWHTLEARATDEHGRVQPAGPPPNSGGYANNAVHKISVTARE